MSVGLMDSESLGFLFEEGGRMSPDSGYSVSGHFPLQSCRPDPEIEGFWLRFSTKLMRNSSRGH